MKKLALAVLAVFCVASAAFASDWGLGLKLGAGQNDPKDMQETYDIHGGELTKGFGLAGIELLYEGNVSETGKLGLKIGADIYGQNEYKYLYVFVSSFLLSSLLSLPLPVLLPSLSLSSLSSLSFFVDVLLFVEVLVQAFGHKSVHPKLSIT